jgi:hypothetical protein
MYRTKLNTQQVHLKALQNKISIINYTHGSMERKKIEVVEQIYNVVIKLVPKGLQHIFWSCNKISKLWEDLNNWIFERKKMK